MPTYRVGIQVIEVWEFEVEAEGEEEAERQAYAMNVGSIRDKGKMVEITTAHADAEMLCE